jgi:hypothetical protein
MRAKPSSSDAALSDPSKTADRGADAKFSMLEFDKDGGVTVLGNSGDFVLSWSSEDNQFVILTKDSHSITIDSDGIKLIDKDGNSINLDRGKVSIIVDGTINLTGKAMNIATGGVSLGSPAPMSAVLGEPLMTWLATHIHTATGAAAPTTPPVVPPPPVILSKAVKLKF